MADSSSLTLYQYGGIARGTTLSPPCGKAHMALAFKGLAYDVKTLRTPMEVRRVNPRGTVPVLQLGDERVPDSTDILTALDERYPDPPLEPEGAEDRARAKLIEDWADEVLYGYGLWTRFFEPGNFERLKPYIVRGLPGFMRPFAPAYVRRMIRKRVRGRGVVQKGTAAVRRERSECFQALAVLLRAGPWLAGERISRADLTVAAFCDQFMLAEITPDLAAELAALPEVVEWLERVHERAPNAARPGTS